MTILSNYYGDLRVRFLCLIFTLTSAFTCAWRDFTVHAGERSLLWVQLSFWNEPSPSLKQKLAGVRLRVCILGREWFHFTALPLVPFMRYYKKPWNKPACLYNSFVWWFARNVVDRRYSKLWEAYKHINANRWAGVRGNDLLEFKPCTIPFIAVPKGLNAKVLKRGTGWVEFQLLGVPVKGDWHEAWVKRGEPYPYCDVSIWFEGEIREGMSLSSYGGELWPTAWPEHFVPPASPNKNTVGHIYLTAKGAALLQAALKG